MIKRIASNPMPPPTAHSVEVPQMELTAHPYGQSEAAPKVYVPSGFQMTTVSSVVVAAVSSVVVAAKMVYVSQSD
jgi:hypothetical protein